MTRKPVSWTKCILKLVRFWPVIACLLLVLMPSALGPAARNSLPLATFSTSDWLSWARTAWQYYQPGVGVNQASGLDRATLSWHCFTDWDLGTYIFSIMFARKLNLISDGSASGDWQFTDRINRLMTFLQNRPLSGQTPYWAYDWGTGEYCSDTGLKLSDSADQGRLLGALHALGAFRPSYSPQVASIFAKGHSAYDTLSTQLGTDYYSYFIAEGYAAFGYDESAVFNGTNSYELGPFDPVYGQQLPELSTLAEPFNLAILEGTTAGYTPSSAFIDFANRDYLAQMGRWGVSGNLTAWSEGVYVPGIDYIDEWVLYTSKTPETWTLIDAAGKVYPQPQYSPFAYTKVAFSFLAIYGQNAYTDELMNAIVPLASSNGFGEAVFENATSAARAFSSAPSEFYADKTNEQVLAAAAYAISHATTSTTTSTNSNSQTSITPTTLAPIPGFSWESIIVGIMLGLSVLAMRRSGKTRQGVSCADPKHLTTSSTQRVG